MMFLTAFVGILRLLREDMPRLVLLMFQSLREWCLSRPSRLLGPPPRGQPWALEKGRGAAADVIDPLEHREHCCCQIVITDVKGVVLVGRLPPLREARLLRYRLISRLTRAAVERDRSARTGDRNPLDVFLQEDQEMGEESGGGEDDPFATDSEDRASLTAWSAPRPRGRSASRSGPKSRGCSFTAVGTLLFLTLFLLGTTGCTAAADARVSGLPAESLGAEVPISAKPCGEPSHVWRAADLPASRKRSFRRAVRRAALRGSTFYRGKQFSSRGLEHIRNNTTNSSFSQRATSNDYVCKRLRILSVNFDGMTTAVYDSFTLWLQTAPYDIVLMQETHRGFGADFSEWQAGAWIFISSPDDKSRFAGVAVAIRTSLATKHTVRSLPVIPGRILHVRLSGCSYSIDVISCYQHVINSRVTQAVNSSRREHFWTSLGRYLAALPFRNMLVVAGDFNCAARREDGIAGFAAPSPNSYWGGPV
eukprot:s4559_g2.t1